MLEVKTEAYTPAFSDTTRFGDMEDLRSPQQESIYSMGSDLASPSTLGSMSPTGPIYSAFPGDDLPQLPFPPPTRNDTVFSSSTEMSTDSVRRIRNRLNVTTIFAKQVEVLMKRLTISGAHHDKGMPPPRGTFSDIPVHHHGRSDPVPHPGLSLPGDFIVARRYVHPCAHQKHFASHLKEGCLCWCVIADEASEAPDNFYITEGDDWCDRACHVLTGQVEAMSADQFGNTALHLFASLDSEKGIETTLYLIQSNRSNPLALNKAGQTVLHVLSAVWFSRLQDSTAPLYKLLNSLWLRGGEDSNAVFLRDVYGRTFFHRLARFVRDAQTLAHITSPYHWAAIPRDAFGVQPSGPSTDHLNPASRRTGTTALSPLAEERKEDDFDIEIKHQRLMHTLTGTYDNHALEDEQGRNGLHCLAEVGLDIPSSSTPSSPTSPNLGSQKRKRGQSDASEGPKAIERRANFLEGLLLQTASGSVMPPDVNHYNKAGYTVLMAFAMHLTDAQDKTGMYIGRIIDLLLQHGARIDMRNREGETALLVAARCGNKNVVTKLLERGANLHARDKNGRGIMGVLDATIESCGERERGLSEYGRLEAVRAVLAKVVVDMGGADEPGFLDEWCRN